MFKELREALLEHAEKKKNVGETILNRKNKCPSVFVFFYFIFEDLKSSASGV